MRTLQSYAFQLTLDLLHKEDVIAFNKGAMYMLGVGLSGGLLIYFMIYEIIYGKISESFNKKATRLAFIFMGSIFIFPQIIDFRVRQYIGHTGYVFCADQLIVGCMRRIWCLLPMRRLVRNSMEKRGRLGC